MAKTFTKDTLHQGQLEKVIRSLFNDNSVFTNVKKGAKIVNPGTGYYLELDIWVPQHKISFEFQDPYHYVTTWDSQIPLASIQHKDALKLEKLNLKGETLIYVPCWWDGSKESIVETVRFHRPDLLTHLPSKVFPISLNPVQFYFEMSGVPGVGELMVASFPVSMKFHRTIRPDQPWWIGEKYDGIRVCWNPRRKRLYTRYGHTLVITQRFVDWFVGIYLDGEIWFGRGNFPDSQRLIKSEIDTINWPIIRVIGFDDATPVLEENEFEVRYKRIVDYVPPFHPFIMPAMRALCHSKKHLLTFTELIIKHGGEGAILRRPRTLYEHGRSTNLLKIKAARGDKEAIVHAVWSDGSYTLKLPDGTKFRVPAHRVTMETRRLKRGDIVTFSYDNVSSSTKPVRPRIFRIRTDVEWEEIIANHARERNRGLNESSQRIVGFTKKPFGYWTSEKGKNMRSFLVKFAQERNLDPLLPDTWYSIARKDIEQEKGGTSMLVTHKGGVVNTIMSLFPDIGLVREKFNLYPFEHWQSIDNRREIFLSYARQRGFDPLKPSNWYSQPKKSLLSIKGLSHVILFYSKSIIQSLVHLFPEIGLEPNRFVTIKKWYDPARRRKLFIDFATFKGFDPLFAKNWYRVSIDTLCDFPGGPSVLGYHKRSLTRALVELFPDIGLDERKFAIVPHHYWRAMPNRRKLFDDYARAKGFNPLVPENWYSISTEKAFAVQGISSILNYYPGRNMVKALVDIYPELNLKEDRFYANTQKFWQDAKNRKRFFVEFANIKGFDPLVASEWYSITNEVIVSHKDGHVLLSHYGGCHITALMNVFPDVGLDVSKFSIRPLRYWQSEANRRQFFMEFAERKAFDALVADYWYSITKKDLQDVKETQAVLSHHRGSFVLAVMALFPGIGLDRSKFSILPKNYWTNIQNRRLFFQQVAQENDFDAVTDAAAWCRIPSDALLSRKGGRSIMLYYKGSLARGLMDVFPALRVDESMFSILPSNFLVDAANRRKIMMNFAREKGFDPLLPTNWYIIKREDVLSIRGIQSLLGGYFKGNYGQMITKIFPDIGLQEDKFYIRKSHWTDVGNRKEFFMRFATDAGFDPLVPSNWIGQRDKFMSHKSASTLLAHYDGSITKALEHLFPDVHWKARISFTRTVE